MKIKKYQLLELYQNIKNNYTELSELKSKKINLALIHNIYLIENQIEKIQNMLKTSDEFNTYQDKRIKLCIEHAKLDKNGNPLIKKTNEGLDEYIIDENVSENFNRRIKELQKEYQTEIDNYLQQVSNYNNEIQTEIDIDFKTFNENDIPDDISFNLLNVIKIFIKD